MKSETNSNNLLLPVCTEALSILYQRIEDFSENVSIYYHKSRDFYTQSGNLAKINFYPLDDNLTDKDLSYISAYMVGKEQLENTKIYRCIRVLVDQICRELKNEFDNGAKEIILHFGKESCSMSSYPIFVSIIGNSLQTETSYYIEVVLTNKEKEDD